MNPTDHLLAKVRAICLALPDTKETITWGEPHFRVGDKIFAGCGEEDGKYGVGFKLEMMHAEEVLEDPRFTRAKYVGRHGWVTLDAAQVTDWDEVRDLIHESYRLIAPKTSQKKLRDAGAPHGDGPKRAASKPAARKRVAKKRPAR